MPKPIKLAYVPELSHAEWLDYRRRGLGGSDAAVIVGLQRFGSELSLWADKKGLLPDREDSEVMRQGRDFEDYVARRWMEATGKKVRRLNYICQNPDYPFALANIDREVVGENAGLECKTTSLYNRSDFESGEIPPAYYVQCQHYMAVMGYERMYLAVLVLSGGFYSFVIERDEDEIAALMNREYCWWMKHIDEGEQPAADGSDSADEVLRILYPSDNGETVLLMDKEPEFDRMEQLTAEIKERETEKEALKQSIMQALGEASAGESERWQVSFKAQQTRRVDSKALRERYPDIYAECSTTSSIRVFRVKKLKKEDKS